MNNLEKIKAASVMGYSATLLFKNGGPVQVVRIWEAVFGGYCIATNDGDSFISLAGYDYEIIGYLYVGQLFGEPVIPIRQRFRVKETGEVLEFMNLTNYGVFELKRMPRAIGYSGSELEPVFD